MGKWGLGQGPHLKHSTWLRGHRGLRLLACGSLLGGGQGFLWVLGPMGGSGRPGCKENIKALSWAQGMSWFFPGWGLLKK